MSTTASQERKRKPTDLNPGSSPASKHIKVESGAMASSGVGDNNPAMGAAQHRAALQQLLNAQTEMAEDAKMKYLAGLVQLRTIVESKGANTPEGLAAQTRYDTIVNRLKLAARQQQHQQQQQQRPQYQGQGQGGAVAANAGTTMGGMLNPAAKQNWIVPPNVPPQNAEQWRTEIQMKLAQVGQKMNHARSQIVMLQQNQSQAGMTPEQQRELQVRIVEHTTQFNHFKEIINKFGVQQKVLAEQKLLQQQQQQTAQIQQQQQIMAQQQQQQQQAQVQAQQNQMRAANQQQQGQQGQQVAMQKPAQQGTVPEGHNPSQQQGMMNAGLQQQQANTINNGQQNPQNHPQQQQPLQSSNPMQQRPQQQPQPQPQQPQQPQQNPHTIANSQQQQQQQRIATPIQRANSPPNPDANRTTMSPAPQLQQQQQQQQPQQQQQQQQQQPQQNGQAQAPRPVLQPVPQPSTVGRSPAPPAAAGTPMAQPNSPAPRSGSVQPRPSTASGTPVPQQASQPGLQQAQPQPQRMQPASSASAASPTISSHPGQTLRDNAQGHRLHIPKSLTIATPQPIAMPPARPTLSGGMNSSGSQIMSTPAIIKQPAFEFDEAGMGLLSKRKLEELVKQIDPEERLDPDVEESILELVDEFIDNIATTACKMAKLRGSDTLDIKDIQIILERNWNIRIPGYAADEIRTVRKFNPAPGYHQKMAALAAQKQLNQTTGKGGD